MFAVDIPSLIEENEILVKYLFNKDFKKNSFDRDDLVEKNLFIPNGIGVSVQRYTYCDEQNCKEKAQSFTDRIYKGFVLFRKSTFDCSVSKYKAESRSEFDAIIKATPLDDNNKYLPISVFRKLTTLSAGNPGHADIIYINPAIREKETPNTAIRSFSRKFAKDCEYIIDQNPADKKYSEKKFKDLI